VSIGLLGVMTADWVYQAVTGYRTGNVQYLEFYLPYSAVLRPVLLFLRFPNLTSTGQQILLTTIKSIRILFLLFLTLVIAAILNMALFNGAFDAGALGGRTFDNFLSSLIQVGESVAVAGSSFMGRLSDRQVCMWHQVTWRCITRAPSTTANCDHGPCCIVRIIGRGLMCARGASCLSSTGPNVITGVV
jgi:hypothetical protein